MTSGVESMYSFKAFPLPPPPLQPYPPRLPSPPLPRGPLNNRDKQNDKTKTIIAANIKRTAPPHPPYPPPPPPPIPPPPPLANFLFSDTLRIR